MARFLCPGLLASLALAYLAHLEGVAALSSGAGCVDNMEANGPSIGNFHWKGRELRQCVREYRQKHGDNFECGRGLQGRTCIQIKDHFQSFVEDLKRCLAGPATATTTTTALPNPRDCKDLFDRGETGDRVTTIFSDGVTPVSVRCIDDATVILNRDAFNPGFNRNYSDYAAGFGDRNGDYYLGNDVLHALTASRSYKLRADIVRPNGTQQSAEYTTFLVGPASDRYRLTVNNYTGNAGDALPSSNAMTFNTADNAESIYIASLAEIIGGGWWMDEEYTDMHAIITGEPGPAYNNVFSWGSELDVPITSVRLRLERV